MFKTRKIISKMMTPAVNIITVFGEIFIPLPSSWKYLINPAPVAGILSSRLRILSPI
jgi:hypothetical protein